MMLPVRRQRRLAYYKFQDSHKEVLEQLNALDTIIYDEAVKLFKRQQEALSGMTA